MRRHGIVDAITINRLLFLSLLYSSTLLIISLFFEYVLKVEACQLCKFQRIPLFFILGFSVFGLFSCFDLNPLKFIQIFLISSFALSSYHLLIQKGTLTDPCSVPQNIESLETFKKTLRDPTPCSQISWPVFGIPINAYNIGLSFSLYAYLRRETKKFLVRLF